jgi:divalent metal cation (Fe/Co/Zn/Cd) transporter
MALSPKAVKYIAIGVIVAVAVLLIGAIVWDILKIAAGILIGGGLIYLGIRFLLGKGLPENVQKLADKAMSSDEEEESE